MKRIFGLDLGTTSIGWAVVNERTEDDSTPSSIVDLGVRIVPLTTDEQNDFTKGKPITTNAGRNLKRGMRRSLQRYKMRRKFLISVLKQNGLISDETILAEDGKDTTFETYRLRAKAATEEISLEEFARVLLMLNKKRGYKSNRKATTEEETGSVIDSTDIARTLYEQQLTPGQYAYRLLRGGVKKLPEFYPSDLRAEFKTIWNQQSQYYPNLLTDELRETMLGENKGKTWTLCHENFGVEGIKSDLKGYELKLKKYEQRVTALENQIDLESLTIVLQDINNEINSASGYLGDISDRSKELYVEGITVGQYKWRSLNNNPNKSLRNKVFYRNDYLNEFEKIWETQAKFHSELTTELKSLIRDVIIFYQRPLKSKKGLVSFCPFESKKVSVKMGNKEVIKMNGSRVCPKSSPIFQEFKTRQTINNLKLDGRDLTDEQKNELLSFSGTDSNGNPLSESEKLRRLTKTERETIFVLLSYLGTTPTSKLLSVLRYGKGVEVNYKDKLEGNATISLFIKKLCELANDGIEEVFDFGKHLTKYGVEEALRTLKVKLIDKGFADWFDISMFDVTKQQLGEAQHDAETESIEANAKNNPNLFNLWHLLYSYESDGKSVSGTAKLQKILQKRYGFSEEGARLFSNLSFSDDYGNLSTKAMRKILVGLREGYTYDKACEMAGYMHSPTSLTTQQAEAMNYAEHLEILPKNSLRNPVVEKIINQLINVMNQLIDTYGKPDEIRVEMARELKKSAQERAEMTKSITDNNARNEKIVEILKAEPYNLQHVSRNDIIRYKLYEELANNGYKTLYTCQYISKEDLFSKNIEIEHIIPQSVLFDDSLSNKTLSTRSENQKKGNRTAMDFIREEYGEDAAQEYIRRILYLAGKTTDGDNKKLKDKLLSGKKAELLLRTMSENAEASGFINRDLNDTQYIAKKAREILGQIIPLDKIVTTVGTITAQLREDWGLINLMQELNMSKYEQAGLTEEFVDHDGKRHKRIIDWTKRGDHRHHAMDALTVAFTTRSHVNYISHLNTKEKPDSQAYGLREILTTTDSGARRFKLPMPDFRAKARRFIERILVSHKAKNKVTTPHVNVTKSKKNNEQITATPRGQLHNETIYGLIKRPMKKIEKINAKFTLEKINTVAKQSYRLALLRRLEQYGGDPAKAFTGKNSLSKNPLYVDAEMTSTVPEKIEVVTMVDIYTIRKAITPDLDVEKVIDEHIKAILKQRLKEYDNEPQKAFANLEENPIWLNREKGIAIKRVTIRGVNEAVALHKKHNHRGEEISIDGKNIATDFVQTGSNHHIAIFEDPDGNLQERVVSFYEATERANQHLPIVDYDYKKDEGWKFLFSMKKNEYFVFPEYDNEGNIVFNPSDIDLLDPNNAAEISKHLFRVQKLASKDYVFRHHLETTVEDVPQLQNKTWIRIKSTNNLRGNVKVRVNHIGKIVAVGEY